MALFKYRGSCSICGIVIEVGQEGWLTRNAAGKTIAYCLTHKDQAPEPASPPAVNAGIQNLPASPAGRPVGGNPQEALRAAHSMFSLIPAQAHDHPTLLGSISWGGKVLRIYVES